MGLLDDAIKEHLELKRRHGADPGEVARLEHEALGPARRDPAPAAVDEPVAAEPAPAQVADHDLFLDDDGEHDEVPAEERLEAPIHHVEREPEPEPVAQEAPTPEPEPPVEVEQPTRQFSLEEVEAATEAPKAPAEPAPPAEADAPPAEDVVPADDEPDGEDVLEETPEFLQETPEHDRLWFEQKPPRDFDF
ncbi:MAG: hypothetical protein ACXVFM_07555 [Solirubrobacteraceae bacterium]